MRSPNRTATGGAGGSGGAGGGAGGAGGGARGGGRRRSAGLRAGGTAPARGRTRRQHRDQKPEDETELPTHRTSRGYSWRDAAIYLTVAVASLAQLALHPTPAKL